MPSGVGLALGGSALASGIGGAIAGSKENPAPVTTQQTTFAPPSQQELNLQQQSLAQYMNALNQMQGYERGISGAQGLQNQARQGVGGIYSGQAFQMTPQEQANVQNLRNQMVNQGMYDVNQFLQQGALQANQGAAARGLRGQASQQMQGDVLRQAGQSATQLQNQANLFAANQAINLPYQRVAAQSPFFQQGMSMADQMRLQAAQNRMAAQSPFMLNLLNQNRQAQGVTTTTGTAQPNPGWLAGAIAGAGQGIGMAGNVMGGIGQYNAGKAALNRYPGTGSSAYSGFNPTQFTYNSPMFGQFG